MANLISKTSENEYSVSVSEEDEESDQEPTIKVRHDVTSEDEGDDDGDESYEGGNGDDDDDDEGESVDSDVSDEEEKDAKSKKRESRKKKEAEKRAPPQRKKKPEAPIKESTTATPTKADQLVAPADVGDFDLADHPPNTASKIKPRLPTKPGPKSKSATDNNMQDVITTKAMADLESHMNKRKAQHPAPEPDVMQVDEPVKKKGKEEEEKEKEKKSHSHSHSRSRSKSDSKKAPEKRKIPPAKPEKLTPPNDDQPAPSSKKRKSPEEMTERGRIAAAAMQRRSNTQAVRTAVSSFCSKKAKTFKSQKEAEGALKRATDLEKFKMELPWWVHHAPTELKEIFPDPFDTVPNYKTWTPDEKKTFEPLRKAPGFQTFAHSVCLDYTKQFKLPHFSEFQAPESDGPDF